MAKVSPYHGRNKFNWKLRLSTLVMAMAKETMAQADDNASSSRTSVTHRGTRLLVSARKLRKSVLESHIAIYSNEGHFTYVLTDKPNAEFLINRPDDQIDYKVYYKRLERLVYRCFAEHRASDIMSRADDAYNWGLE